MGYGDIMEYIWMNLMVDTWRKLPSIRQCVQMECNGRYLYRKSSKKKHEFSWVVQFQLRFTDGKRMRV
jgi:hypothetical protein